jgi:hypothetical protein
LPPPPPPATTRYSTSNDAPATAMLPEVVHDWIVYAPSVVVGAPVTVTAGF